jgi:hypothetical protein
MGIYNNIHDVNDDKYYYCSVNDCPCHSPDYYDSSRNLNLKYEYNDEHDVYFNYVNHDYYNDKYNNDKYNGSFTGYLN